MLISGSVNAGGYGGTGYSSPSVQLMSPQQKYEAQVERQKDLAAKQFYENQQMQQQIQQQQYEINQMRNNRSSGMYENNN